MHHVVFSSSRGIMTLVFSHTSTVHSITHPAAQWGGAAVDAWRCLEGWNYQLSVHLCPLMDIFHSPPRWDDFLPAADKQPPTRFDGVFHSSITSMLLLLLEVRWCPQRRQQWSRTVGRVTLRSCSSPLLISDCFQPTGSHWELLGAVAVSLASFIDPDISSISQLSWLFWLFAMLSANLWKTVRLLTLSRLQLAQH